jgi:hypothetical protein
MACLKLYLDLNFIQFLKQSLLKKKTLLPMDPSKNCNEITSEAPMKKIYLVSHLD